MVVQVQQFFEFCSKSLWVFEVLYAQCTACNFVFIGGANATTRGANFLGAALFACSFTCNIERCVEGQNERASFADAQT